MNGHLSFDEGWKVLEQGIVKCSKILECTSTRPTVAEYMNCYDCAYRMAVQKNHYCQEMYNGFKTTLAECVRAMANCKLIPAEIAAETLIILALAMLSQHNYIHLCYVDVVKCTCIISVLDKVLPHLTQKKSDHFFKELVRMWSNYCTMIRFVTGFFSYLDRCYLDQYKLPSLYDTAATSFFGTVFSYFGDEARDSLLTMIRQERDGSMVDMELLDVLRGISCSEVETLMKNAVLEDTYAYYSKRSSEWIMHYSLPDYLAKVQETMEKETKRLAHYLCISDEDSLHFCLQAVSPPLMQTYDSYAREKNIGGELLLQTYKTVEDELLARCSGLTLDGCSDNSSFNGTK